MVRFYDKMPDMECLAGDTLPSFIIEVDADNLNGCRMQLLIASYDEPEQVILSKDGSQTDNGFIFTLTSEDTKNLSGLFRMHFRFVGSDGLSRRKLSGVLRVIPVPLGV